MNTGEKRVPLCPFCRASADDDGCEHLVFSGESDSIAEILGVLGLPEERKEFSDANRRRVSVEDVLNRFIQDCAAAHAYSEPWGGEMPGLSGRWTFVWSADKAALAREVGERLAKAFQSKQVAPRTSKRAR